MDLTWRILQTQTEKHFNCYQIQRIVRLLQLEVSDPAKSDIKDVNQFPHFNEDHFKMLENGGIFGTPFIKISVCEECQVIKKRYN